MAYKKDLNEQDEAILVSRINAAGIINITLENLWKDCYSAMASGNLSIWNRKLDAIWVILGGDVKEGEQEDKDIKKLNERIYKTGSLNYKSRGFATLTDKESELKSMQYILLNEKSLFLRRLQNKQGKGTAYVSDDDSDFD